MIFFEVFNTLICLQFESSFKDGFIKSICLSQNEKSGMTDFFMKSLIELHG